LQQHLHVAVLHQVAAEHGPEDDNDPNDCEHFSFRSVDRSEGGGIPDPFFHIGKTGEYFTAKHAGGDVVKVVQFAEN
jgi:hypothetical protein